MGGKRGEEFAGLRANCGRRVARPRRYQDVIAGLQLGQVLDALPDASLKCVLQRKTDAGDTDRGTSRMHGVGHRRIELRPEADQAGSIGGGQFENLQKPGRRVQQLAALARFGLGRASIHRGCGSVAKRLQQGADIGVGLLRLIGKQR